MNTHYRQQITCARDDIDLAFWRSPDGISVPDDELQFLLVPDAVQSMAAGELAHQVQQYQRDHANSGDALTLALMVTMGGLLPGILLHDHLKYGRGSDRHPINFGTIGVSFYAGPDKRLDEPVITQPASHAVSEQTVLLIDDLGDRGDTLAFLARHLTDHDARRVMNLMVYVKPRAAATCTVDFCFGEVAQDTWIITPRERVETLVKRVPVWKARGASEAECRRRLVELIGYPVGLVDDYLPAAYASGQT